MEAEERKATDSEDRRKLHLAINQIDNQRFLLTTGGITLVITALGLWLNRIPPTGPSMRFSCLFSMALLILLSVVYFYSWLLRNLLREFATYLRLKNASEWEHDRLKYRKLLREKSEWHDNGVSLVFLVLGASAISFPWLVESFYQAAAPPWAWALAQWVVSALYVASIIGTGFLGWFDREEHAERRWRQVLGQQSGKRELSTIAPLAAENEAVPDSPVDELAKT